MKTLNSVALVISKIFEIVCWVGVVALILGLVFCLAIPKNAVLGVADAIASDPELAAEIDRELASDPDFAKLFSVEFGIRSIAAMAEEYLPRLRTGGSVGCLGGAILTALMAMIFRNVYLIVKTTKGETWFAQGSTPFQPNVIRMLREIGIFSIAVPVLNLILNIVLQAILGPEVIVIGVNLLGILLGLLVLWLTQAFTYGAQLEQDAEGLI